MVDKAKTMVPRCRFPQSKKQQKLIISEETLKRLVERYRKELSAVQGAEKKSLLQKILSVEATLSIVSGEIKKEKEKLRVHKTSSGPLRETHLGVLSSFEDRFKLAGLHEEETQKEFEGQHLSTSLDRVLAAGFIGTAQDMYKAIGLCGGIPPGQPMKQTINSIFQTMGRREARGKVVKLSFGRRMVYASVAEAKELKNIANRAKDLTDRA